MALLDVVPEGVASGVGLAALLADVRRLAVAVVVSFD